VVVARTLSGDLLFVTCRSAGLEWLNETLIQLDVDAAVLLGRGGINTITFDRDWKQAFSSSQAQPATLELRLVPVKPRARTGVTDFKAPLQSD
jgi:hypothetical protein